MAPIERMLFPALMMLVVSSSVKLPTTIRLRAVLGFALMKVWKALNVPTPNPRVCTTPSQAALL